MSRDENPHCCCIVVKGKIMLSNINLNYKRYDMYIFPECIAYVKWKLLNKNATRSPDDEKFQRNKQIHLLSFAYRLKDICASDFRQKQKRRHFLLN